MKKKPIYVIDTNVLVDYVDIVPAGTNWHEPKEPSVDLSYAHIVIPSVVIRELSDFKDEKSYRGKAAREVLRRVRALTEQRLANMWDNYHFHARAEIRLGKQEFHFLPIHKDFAKALPFKPSDRDKDGQIILAALTVACLRSGLPIDGSASAQQLNRLSTSGITVLTNDNGMAIRARERGLATMRYGYKYSEPYTGRRDVVVPSELYEEQMAGRKIERDLWNAFMPGERPLIANEFIVMRLADTPATTVADPYFRNIARYDEEEDMLVPLECVSEFPIHVQNAGQAIYAEALMNPKFAAVICTGAAGCGKTYMSTIYGYDACRIGRFIGVTVVPCKNRSDVGTLPGDLDEKMDPDVQPLKNALRNFFLAEDAKFRKELEKTKRFGASLPLTKDVEVVPLKGQLEAQVNSVWQQFFTNIPVDNASGRDFSHELAIYDEFQDQSASQADTLIKRLGAEGKIVITGDVGQIHAPYLDESNNGLVYASQQLMGSPMVAQVCFTEDEIIRHPLVRMIAMRQKAAKKK
ncbi:PhoH family protein [Candidatus Saccharibacteria bacterium]|nr:PhoH family protein [Candidatus Saccharibacteria bacterium]